MKRQVLVRALWILVAVAIVLVVLRSTVGDVYHVASGSMEPTIRGESDGGEWVFVRYDRSPPTRQELVVVLRAGEPTPIVKRVLGLPGETVQLSAGDVLVDRKRLGPDEPRAPWIPLYDEDHEPIAPRFSVPGSNAWTAHERSIDLDARGVARDDQAGIATLRELDDGWLDESGRSVHGDGAVDDARIECTFTARDVGARLRLGLTEQGDTFEAHVTFVADGDAEIEITRRNQPDGPSVLARTRARLALDQPKRITFENRDDVVTLRVDGEPPLSAAYKENVLHPLDQLEEHKSFAPRAWFGGDGGRFAFEHVRVLRDLDYTSRGTFGVQAPLDLAPDELYVLGDHSSKSRDSREWGPVKLSEVVGRPVAVVWPPSHWRVLRAVEAAR